MTMSSSVEPEPTTRVGRLDRKLIRWVFVTLLLVVLALAPLAGSRHVIGIWTVALIFAGISSGWAVAGGLSGLIPLGHAAYFGIGAYASALAFAEYDLSPWVGIGAGIVVAGALGWLMTLLAVRFKVRGPYFALYTLAWAEVLRILVSNWTFGGKTNGVLVPYKVDAGAADLQFSDPRGFYAVALAYLLLAMTVFFLVKRSKLGWRLSAIRGDEATAAASGINVSRSLTSSMAISGAVTSIGGGLYAQYIQFIDPELAFNVSVSIDIAVRAIIGGPMLLLGPLIGSSVLSGLTEVTQRYMSDLPTASLLFVGVAIICLAHWFPSGIGGIGLKIKRAFGRRGGNHD